MKLEDSHFIVDCFQEAQLNVLEVSLNQPNSLKVLEKLKMEFGKDMTIGAGTVLNKEIAKEAENAGAAFFLGPNVSKEVAEIASKLKVPYIHGALSPTEILYANVLVAEWIKFFRVRHVWASYIN